MEMIIYLNDNYNFTVPLTSAENEVFSYLSIYPSIEAILQEVTVISPFISFQLTNQSNVQVL